MTGSVPSGMPPVRIRPRRTAGDVAAGLGALLVLVALLGGVPYVLLRYAGPPLPAELRDPGLLTGRLDTGALVAVLVLLVWSAWLQLAVCVAVEGYAGIRRVGMPVRVPLSGGTQALARRLVSAVLLLFTTTAVAAPAAYAHAPAADPAPVAALTVSPDSPEQTASVMRQPPALQHVGGVKKVYIVRPPEGRHHESLWEIAEKCLGDGRRYREIYELNKHEVQPDGSRLRISDLIRPGWVLDMPDDAVDVHVVPADQSRAEILARHRTAPAEADGRTDHGLRLAPGGDATAGQVDAVGPVRDGGTERAERRERDAGPGTVARSDVIDTAPMPATPPGEPEPPRGPEPEQAAAPDRPTGLEPVDCLAGASLAAVGLLAALGWRRREQFRRRPVGRRVVRPRGDAAAAELALRLGADTPGSRMLDLALRLLGRTLAEQGRTPPTVCAAHLSAYGLDLWIHPPRPVAPEPWTAQDGGRVWRLTARAGREIDEGDLVGAPAPYPGLVSLGTDATGRVLVDLETAHGLIAVTGAHTTAALAALAVELATNRWSDGTRVTLVGFGAELVAVAPDRVRYAATLGEVLAELEEDAATRAWSGDEALTGRIATGRPAGRPHYLLSALRPRPEEAVRLTALARTGARTATGYVVAGELPHAAWTWHITPDGTVRVAALGLTVQAQLLPPRHYAAIIDLFRTADDVTGERLPDDLERPPGGPFDDPFHEPSARPPGEPCARPSGGPPDEPPGGPHDGTPVIEVRILGPIEIGPVGPLEPGRADLVTELVVYLATHPGGVHPAVLGGMLWPRGVPAEVRDAVIARAAAWLGTDAAGRSHLYADESGRLHLGPGVRTDWRLFCDLVRRGALDRALDLVRGPLLHGRPPGRYAWLAVDALAYDVAAVVADAARRRCAELLAAGDPERAVAAAQAGLRLAAEDEGLWRDLLRAVHATGDPARLRATVDALYRWAAAGPYGGPAPETEALVDELLPSWRAVVAGTCGHADTGMTVEPRAGRSLP